MNKKLLLLLVAFQLGITLPASSQASQDSTGPDTGQTPSRAFKKIDILPAISYAPETKLTLGVIGYYYLDFYRDDPATKLSNINFLAVYTTANQIAVELEWDLFTNGNRWRFRGESFYNKYPDRNYGLGNDAALLIAETEESGERDTVNYFRFDSDRIRFAPIALRRFGKHLYLGVQGQLETLYRLRPLPDQYEIISEDPTLLTGLPVDGWRSGLGLQMLYDTRDYVLNPIKGTFLEVNTLHFMSWLGSDYPYHHFEVDARKYINPVLNHTIALRAVAGFRFSDEAIPLRGLSRIGGRDFIRGYFKGTYQDNHMLAFEAEYRLPFWREGKVPGFWKFWKRLGIVAFLSGAQVAPDVGDFGFNRFRLAAGGGLRILFNEASRVNLRIDYAVALAPGSNGPGSRQTGLYFYLAEAF